MKLRTYEKSMEEAVALLGSNADIDLLDKVAEALVKAFDDGGEYEIEQWIDRELTTEERKALNGL